MFCSGPDCRAHLAPTLACGYRQRVSWWQSRAAVAGSSLVAIVGATVILVGESRAELENQVFTSRTEQLRLIVPRGWRATDQPSYPGLLLWMMRSQPRGQIVLTSEAFTRELFCSWPVACRTSPDSLAHRYACALRTRLQALRMSVGPTQPGPRDTEDAGLPSVWFEYDDGKRFLRHAIALGGDRAVSVVLSAPSNEVRATHVRSFEQALRTLRRIAAPDEATSEAVARTAPDDAGVPTTVQDAGAIAAATVARFESAPAPTQQNPVGPCPVAGRAP